MSEPTWTRGADAPSYWKADLRWLLRLPDEGERVSSVFDRLAHSQIGGGATALARVSRLIEAGDLPANATVADAIAAIKRLHRAVVRG